MKKEKRFHLPVGYRDSMSELDDALEKTSSSLVEKKVIVTYKNELDWKQVRYNLIFLLPFFVFSFIISHGSWWFALVVTALLGTIRTWRKVDDSLSKEKQADLEASKALVHMLMETGQIKEQYSDEEIQEQFEKQWQEKKQNLV